MKFFHFNSTSVERPVYCRTSVIEVLKSFQYFSPHIRAAAITLHAQELGINSLLDYAIAHARTQGFAHLAGLGGVN